MTTPTPIDRRRPARRIALSAALALGLVSALVASVSSAFGGIATADRGGAPTASSTNLELVSPGGAEAPRYVVTSTRAQGWRYHPGVTGLAELRWGDGGAPVLVRLPRTR